MIRTFKLGVRYKQLKSCLTLSRQQEVRSPGSLLVYGWTVVEDRLVSGIFAPADITNTEESRLGAWFSALPRSQGDNTRNMLAFTLGLNHCQVMTDHCINVEL